MQQQPNPRSRAFSLFRPRPLEEIPQTYSWFEEMRTNRPVFQDEVMPLWQVFRYEDVLKVLTDYARFSSKPLGAFTGSFLEDTLVTKDPPDHRKLRNLVNQAFTPRAVARLADRITQITQELLEQVRPQGKMDIVSDIAFPLPAKVIAEMLGVPSGDWDIFQRWARVDSSDPAAARQETTKNLIANAIVCFTDHPGAMERLIREPALMPTAIEEVLRYLPPVWFLFRQTRTGVELGGQHIPADQVLLAWTASANRDPAQFPNPDKFDIQREPNRHLAFGHGIHFCVGAPLARLEARIALPMMLEQLRDMQRVEGAPITVHMGIVLVIRSLPVTFQPSE